MRGVVLRVTKEAIAQDVHNQRDCPVAQAAMATGEFDWAFMHGAGQLEVKLKGVTRIHWLSVPKRVEAWVEEYDTRIGKVEPMSFEVLIPS